MIAYDLDITNERGRDMESTRISLTVPSLTIRGAESSPVSVSASYVNDGVPEFTIEGVREQDAIALRSTLRCAIRAAGFTLPRTLHVAVEPIHPMTSTDGLALPIATAILALTCQIPPESIEQRLVAGNLDLDGRVLPCKGIRLFQLHEQHAASILSSRSLDGLVLHDDLACSAVLGIERLGDLRYGPGAQAKLSPARSIEFEKDLLDVEIDETVARAIEVACAGSHHLVLVGKDTGLVKAVAERVATCLPKATPDERAGAAAISSINEDPTAPAPVGRRPVRCWDARTGSLPGLIGGGRPVAPGAVTEASEGTLIIDHFDEMSSYVAPMLAQAVRERVVHVVRADGAYDMPTNTLVIGCMETGGKVPAAFRDLPCVVAEVAPPVPGYEPVRSSQLQKRIKEAWSFSESHEDRCEAYSAHPEDLVARTIADLDGSPTVEIRHQEEAHRLTREATGSRFIHRIPARLPEMPLGTFANEKNQESMAMTQSWNMERPAPSPGKDR